MKNAKEMSVGMNCIRLMKGTAWYEYANVEWEFLALIN